MRRRFLSKSLLSGLALVSWLSASFLLVSGTLAATKKPPLQPINPNAATSEELQLMPGIGPATAEKILLTRKSYGAFKSVDDLLAIAVSAKSAWKRCANI